MNDSTILLHAKNYLYCNARILDRKRYEYFFENGSKEAVIEALRSYQNHDGGFGNGLEPDIRCPYSQPVPTEMALMIMDEIDYFDTQILDGIINYLRELTLPDGGFPYVLSNASEYPHAPWWSAKQDDVPSINPTGRIIGLLYKQQIRTDIFAEEWFQKNVAYIHETFSKHSPEGYHDTVQWITYLQYAPNSDEYEQYKHKLDQHLALSSTIERDPNAEGYVHKVLDWVPIKESYCYPFVSIEDIDIHLKSIIKQQQEDGGWSINWPPLSEGVNIEWRGHLTVERLKTLRSFGVID